MAYHQVKCVKCGNKSLWNRGHGRSLAAERCPLFYLDPPGECRGRLKLVPKPAKQRGTLLKDVSNVRLAAEIDRLLETGSLPFTAEELSHDYDDACTIRGASKEQLDLIRCGVSHRAFAAAKYNFFTKTRVFGTIEVFDYDAVRRILIACGVTEPSKYAKSRPASMTPREAADLEILQEKRERPLNWQSFRRT
jgi:hypothetical protein